MSEMTIIRVIGMGVAASVFWPAFLLGFNMYDVYTSRRRRFIFKDSATWRDRQRALLKAVWESMRGWDWSAFVRTTLAGMLVLTSVVVVTILAAVGFLEVAL